jgi:hypothetical protein
MMTDAVKTGVKKPDVTQPGVLPPPQETMKLASAVAPAGGVVPAGGVQAGVQPTVKSSSVSPLAKLAEKTERKVPATEMAVAWRNRIAYLPDPTRNGAMGAGLAGQLFLYGGPNLEFALADGTLTVDLVDETPRPPGTPAASPERWQFDKKTLRNLRTVDETFGKSYVLFLPWPAYKANITRVRISARYDPDNGHTLYATPSTLSIDTSGPLGTQVWDGTTMSKPIGAGAPSQASPGLLPGGIMPMGGTSLSNATPLNPIPLGGGSPASGMSPFGGPIPLDGSASPARSQPFAMPTMPAASTMPATPAMQMPPGFPAPTATAPPAGAMPMEPLPPLGITLPQR